MKILNKDELIKRFKEKHEDKYNYDLVNYKNNRTKIKIICPEHGVFEQQPSSHLNGSGCSICGYLNIKNKRTITTEEFIKKSILIHGNKYDYNLADYKNTHTKVKLICSKHGIFEQLPSNHIRLKQGCPSCFGNKKILKDDFIGESKKIHGSKYDYSLVDYKNNFTKIKIICSIHGIFEQKPINHIIQKQGCLKCSGKNQKTTDEFISLAEKIHDGLYDYSLVEYVRSHDKVKIICKKHGVFEQSPKSHIGCKKQGCPTCKKSKGENIIIKILEDNKFNFIHQKEFDNCIDKRRLSFDFYLPDHNLCIEYDGIQHFESIDFWGGNDNLKYIQEHDKIKTDYCKNNNIKLIRIKYDRKLNQQKVLDKIYTEL